MRIDNSIYTFEEADVVFIGYPKIRSKTPNPLSKRGPDLLRFALNNKDDYDPNKKDNIFDKLKICDLGNLEKFELDHKYNNQTLIIVGGDHSITNDITNELMYKKDFHLIVFDAHLDVREKGEENACFLRKVIERMDSSKVHLIGQRIFSKEEDEFINSKGIKIEEDIVGLSGKDIYISFDIDVIDDIYVPSCSTPEPLGKDLQYYINILKRLVKNNNVIGIDFVEFAGENYDITYSNIAHLIMEILKVLKDKR